MKEELGNVMCQSDPNPELMTSLSQQMDDIQQKLNAMEVVEAMTTSRQQFSELMNQVNRVLEIIITGELPQSGGCSGNCSGCSGCH